MGVESNRTFSRFQIGDATSQLQNISNICPKDLNYIVFS